MNSPEKIKLFNKGKSTIHYGDPITYDEKTGKPLPQTNKGSIAPDECVAFEPALAAKLRRMYPRKLLSLEDVRAQFEKKHEAPESTEVKDIVAKAVNEALAQAIPAAVEKALAEERARVTAEIENYAAPLKPVKEEEKEGKKESEESDEELLDRLEKEEAEAKAKIADKKAKKAEK